jgi:hypothetical protein
MKYLLTFFIIFIGFELFGQEFTTKVNRDTVLLGNTFKIEYSAQQLDGEFEGPNLDNLHVISGPNSSMSLNIINGVADQKLTYSYTIKPLEEGVIEIDPAYLITQDTTFEGQPLMIYVVPNPDGIIQQDNSRYQDGMFNMNPFGEFQKPQRKVVKPKNKRKIKRI